MPLRIYRSLILASCLAAIATSRPALAQETTDYPPACDASHVSKLDVDRAHTVFLSGKMYLEESNYDKAIGYFKDAYSIDCSVHAILPIIATAYERKGDRAEAVRALEEYLRRAPDAPDHDIIERRIKNLKDQIAREQSAAAPPAPAASPAPATAAPAAPSQNEPAPPSPPSAPPPPASAAPSLGSTSEGGGHSALPWVVVVVGGAAVVTGAVLLGVGAGDVSSALNACNNVRSPCPSPTAVDQGNSGRTLEQVGGPLVGVGLALSAVGLVWHFLEKPATGVATGSTALHVTPEVSRGYGGVALGARF